MLPTLFVTLAALTLSAPSPLPSSLALRPMGVKRTASPAPAPPTATSAAVRPEELYSLRARRRFAAYLRMRLLELRSEGLNRAADVIERRLPVDDLIPK
jgi:hypothetical protein